MEAVHRYEGTVNQVMGDGIMALFGAPVAHEDHAVRACYAALGCRNRSSGTRRTCGATQGTTVQIRIGLNSGEVVVRAIGSDLRMDYTAVGQTTHLAARMEQLADPGSTLLTANTLALVEGHVQVKPLGPMPVKGLAEPVAVYELLGASDRPLALPGGGGARADGIRRARRRDGAALSGARPREGRAWARSSPSSASPASASRACITSSPTRIASRTAS